MFILYEIVKWFVILSLISFAGLYYLICRVKYVKFENVLKLLLGYLFLYGLVIALLLNMMEKLL